VWNQGGDVRLGCEAGLDRPESLRVRRSAVAGQVESRAEAATFTGDDHSSAPAIAGDVIEGGVQLSDELRVLLFAIYISVELGAILIGFLIFGGYLGLRPALRRKRSVIV
jgi:hypothetical protein